LDEKQVYIQIALDFCFSY